MTENVSTDFESFAAGRYPRHYKRLVATRRALRMPIVKAVLGVNVFFGAPVCALIWAGRLVLEQHATSLQDGPQPLAFLPDLDVYTQGITAAVLVVFTLIGMLVGWARSRRLGLAAEEDEMRLRNAFFLEEWADSQGLANPMPAARLPQRTSEVVVRRPSRQAAGDFPPLTDLDSADRDGPSVAPSDFSSEEPLNTPGHRRA